MQWLANISILNSFAWHSLHSLRMRNFFFFSTQNKMGETLASRQHASSIVMILNSFFIGVWKGDFIDVVHSSDCAIERSSRRQALALGAITTCISLTYAKSASCKCCSKLLAMLFCKGVLFAFYYFEGIESPPANCAVC